MILRLSTMYRRFGPQLPQLTGLARASQSWGKAISIRRTWLIFGIFSVFRRMSPILLSMARIPVFFRVAETEAVLDVEWSGAVAKGATINLVIAGRRNHSGVDLAAIHAVENNIAPIVSESFLQCELVLGAAGNSFQNAIREQAAAQGITFLNASGDQGSAGCDFFQGLPPAPATHGLMVNGLATSPYGVAVGGTDFLNFGQNVDFNSPSPYWSLPNDTTSGVSAWLRSRDHLERHLHKQYVRCFKGAVARRRPVVIILRRRMGGHVQAGEARAIARLSNGNNPSSCTGGYPKPSGKPRPEFRRWREIFRMFPCLRVKGLWTAHTLFAKRTTSLGQFVQPDSAFNTFFGNRRNLGLGTGLCRYHGAGQSIHGILRTGKCEPCSVQTGLLFRPDLASIAARRSIPSRAVSSTM